ncbi:MAG: DUF1573 domain-containing protein [Bacteroidia bacterium]|nr:DUF1573 domain-containing protein [Bacteroidia bacterium]
MKSISTLILLFIACAAFAQDKPTISLANDNQAEFKFNEEEHNFGTIKQGESVTHDFMFTNVGKEPLIISNAQGSCGCTVPTWPKEPIAAGKTGVIKVTFNSTGKLGMQDKTVTLTSNAKQSSMIIHMKGTVEKPIEQPAVDVNQNKK